MSEAQPEYIPIVMAAAFLANESKNLRRKQETGMSNFIKVTQRLSGNYTPTSEEKFWYGYSLKSRVESNSEFNFRYEEVLNQGKHLESLIEQGILEAKENPYCVYEVRTSSFIETVKKDYSFSQDELNNWLNALHKVKQNKVSVSSSQQLSPQNINKNTKINSNTFKRLIKAIDEFPAKYPDYKTRSPKLDADVRAWLRESEIATNDREAHIFGTIISEHFNFLPDR